MSLITPKPAPHKIAYNDFYLRLIACILAAHIIVAYGETISVFQMLLMPTYYYALIPSFFIAMALFSIIRTINIRLDQKYDWIAKPLERFGTQVFFGLILPAISAFVLATVYFYFRNRDILSTSYLQYDFHLILMQLLMINIYYIAYYFYLKWRHADMAVSNLAPFQADQFKLYENETFVINKATGNLVLNIDDIAYFFRAEESNFLRTTGNEDYFIGSSLDEVQQQLPTEMFFRANRQLILQRHACKGFELLAYGKLNAIIEPPFSETVISQKRAVAFKKWLEDI